MKETAFQIGQVPAILYAGQDHLTRRQEAEAFAARFR